MTLYESNNHVHGTARNNRYSNDNMKQYMANYRSYQSM